MAPHSTPPPLKGDWLSLTDLGRVYGISAVHTGKLLAAAGLRGPSGEPTHEALSTGLANRSHSGHQQALWHRRRCGRVLERQGEMPRDRRELVGLWADLLSALQQGSPSVSTSAEEMAGDLPRELVSPVNRALRERGCSFQVRRGVKPAAAPRPAGSPAPAAGADALRRCD